MSEARLNPNQVQGEAAPGIIQNSGNLEIAISAEVTQAAAPVADVVFERRIQAANHARNLTSVAQLQEFVENNFLIIKENADRLREQELITEEIWRALHNQNAMQQNAELIRQIASSLHTAGENKDLSVHQMIRLLNNVDTDLSLVRSRAVNERLLGEITDELHRSFTVIDQNSSSEELARASNLLKAYIEESRGATQGQAIARLTRALEQREPKIILAEVLPFLERAAIVHSSVVRDSTRMQVVAQTRELEIDSESRVQVQKTQREAERRKLLAEVQQAAEAQAKRDFADSPATRLNQRNAAITLEAILKKHPEFVGDSQIQKQMLERFKESYQNQFDSDFDSMGFLKRKYYGFRRQWSENFEQMGNFFSRITKNAVQAVCNLPKKVAQVAEVVIDKGAKVLKAARDVAVGVFNAATNIENWVGIAKGAANILMPAATALYNIAAHPIRTCNAICNVVTKVADVICDPETWSKVSNALSSFKDAAISLAKDVWNNPAMLLEGAAKVRGFLYQVGSALGINDMVYGVGKFIEGGVRFGVSLVTTSCSTMVNTAKLLTGSISFDQFTANLAIEYQNGFGKSFTCFKESLVAARGAVKAFGEFSGITDLALACYYTAKGDKFNAALHGSFALMSWGAIAATVATGGAAAGAIVAVTTGRATMMQAVKQVGKVALKSAAKEGAEAMAKQAGEEVLEKIAKETGQELSEKVAVTTAKIVEQGVSELAEQVAKQGEKALIGEVALASVRESFEAISYKEIKLLVKELKLEKHVHDVVLKMLKEIDGQTVRQISEQLAKNGVPEEVAKSSAKALKKALKKGMSDDELVEIFTKEITQEVTDYLTKQMEKPFREAMQAALRGELKTDAGRKLAHEMSEKGIKLTEKQIDDLVDAAWDGCKAGAKKAIREVVEQGVKNAFRHFRAKHHKLPEQEDSLASAKAMQESADEVGNLKHIVEQSLEQQPHMLAGDGAGAVRQRSSRKNTIFVDGDGKKVDTEFDEFTTAA